MGSIHEVYVQTNIASYTGSVRTWLIHKPTISKMIHTNSFGIQVIIDRDHSKDKFFI